jgi:hypothetical protein
MQCLLYKIYFWKGFSYVLQIDMQLICAPMLAKFYSYKKWVLQVWFEKNKNSLNLKFKSYNTSWMGQTRKDFIQASKIHNELLSGTVAATVTLGVSQPSPLTEISSRDWEGVAALTDTVNNYTIPHYGKTRSGWQEWRKSSLSQVASSEWLLHCILKNLIVLHLVTRSF